jgi:hypothetical protein
MTAYQKAKQIYDEYFIICQEFTEEIQCGLQAKKCAINHVSAIIFEHANILPLKCNFERIVFWDDVKKEIEKII